MNRVTLIGLIFFSTLPLVAGADAVPVPRDTAYPGTITLQVDATDVVRRVFRTHETVPVRAGALVLQYPKWLPGNHGPNGPIEQLAGPQITAQGKPLSWERDPYDVYSFHVQVPKGVTALEIDLQLASPETKEQGRIAMTSEILGVQWEKMLLYPAGHYMSRIQFEPSVTLPKDWAYAAALNGAQRVGDRVQFGSVPLDTLIDSPVFAGRYFKRVQLDHDSTAPAFLNAFADSPDELEISNEALTAHTQLVAEARELFQSHHYDHYDFLLSISDTFSGIGLEHHRSSENGVHTGYFKEWDKKVTTRDLLAHEMVHSWNGKFRRPADLWTPTSNVPMADSLLWVYEGQTQYWGYVLAARSGLWSPEIARGALAVAAARLQEQRPGRAWRNLQDTTNQPVITPRRPQSWVSWQRTEDYYLEGALIWLDIDTQLRARSGGRVSLDDFARKFFGVDDGSYVSKTYTFGDVTRALNELQPDDWTRFLRTRLDSHGPGAPLNGLAQGGWRLVFKDTPSTFGKKSEDAAEVVDRSFSLGLIIDKESKLTQVVWDSPAYRSGVTLGATLVAINGRAYSKSLLDQAILNARDPAQPVELLIKDLDTFRTVKLDYSGGPRFPELERVENTPDMLTAILKPRKG